MLTHSKTLARECAIRLTFVNFYAVKFLLPFRYYDKDWPAVQTNVDRWGNYEDFKDF